MDTVRKEINYALTATDTASAVFERAAGNAERAARRFARASADFAGRAGMGPDLDALRFQAWRSGGGAGHGGGGWLHELGATAGRRSQLGHFAELLAGGGVVGGATLFARHIAEGGRAIQEAAIKYHAGELSGREMAAEMVRGVPVLGEFTSAWDEIRDAGREALGMKSARREMAENQALADRQNRAADLQERLRIAARQSGMSPSDAARDQAKLAREKTLAEIAGLAHAGAMGPGARAAMEANAERIHAAELRKIDLKEAQDRLAIRADADAKELALQGEHFTAQINLRKQQLQIELAQAGADEEQKKQLRRQAQAELDQMQRTEDERRGGVRQAAQLAVLGLGGNRSLVERMAFGFETDRLLRNAPASDYGDILAQRSAQGVSLLRGQIAGRVRGLGGLRTELLMALNNGAGAAEERYRMATLPGASPEEIELAGFRRDFELENDRYDKLRQASAVGGGIQAGEYSGTYQGYAERDAARMQDDANKLLKEHLEVLRRIEKALQYRQDLASAEVGFTLGPIGV